MLKLVYQQKQNLKIEFLVIHCCSKYKETDALILNITLNITIPTTTLLLITIILTM